MKQPDLDKLTKTCTERGDVRVAACQSHALNEAPGMFVDADGLDMLTACEEKLAGDDPRTARRGRGHDGSVRGAP